MKAADFMSWIFILFLGLCWIITGGLMSKVAWYMFGQRKKDDQLHAAFWYAFWAAVMTWVCLLIFFYLVYLIVAGTVLLFVGGGGEAAAGEVALSDLAIQQGQSAVISNKGKINKYASTFCFTAIFILVIISGILSALCASQISYSNNYKSGKNKTVKQMYLLAIISASVDLGAIGALIIGWIIHEVQKHKAVQRR